MEMFLVGVYVVSVIAVSSVLFATKAKKINAEIEKGFQQAAEEKGYDSVDEMPGYILVTARIVAWIAVLALAVLPVVNTVLTFRLVWKVYRHMTAE